MHKLLRDAPSASDATAHVVHTQGAPAVLGGLRPHVRHSSIITLAAGLHAAPGKTAVVVKQPANATTAARPGAGRADNAQATPVAHRSAAPEQPHGYFSELRRGLLASAVQALAIDDPSGAYRTATSAAEREEEEAGRGITELCAADAMVLLAMEELCVQMTRTTETMIPVRKPIPVSRDAPHKKYGCRVFCRHSNGLRQTM